MEHTYSAGGIVINPKGEVAVTNQRGNSWSLPKGHLDADEDALAAAVREIKEETGLSDLVLVRELGSYDRYRIGPHGVGDDPENLKTITMFLFTSESIEPLVPEDPENPEARWVPVGDVSVLLTHQKDKEFFESIKSQLGLA